MGAPEKLTNEIPELNPLKKLSHMTNSCLDSIMDGTLLTTCTNSHTKEEAEALKDTELLQDPRRNYHKATKADRDRLVQLIDSNHLTIKLAAQKVGINYSTAKHIFKKH